MKKFEKLLFIYSIAAVTAILITFGLYSPMPQNLISGLLLLPILLYFWLRMTNPQEVKVPRWSGRLLIIVVVLCALGVYAGFLSRLINKEPVDGRIDELRKEAQEKIDKLQADVDEYKQKEEDYRNLNDELAGIRDEISRLSAEGKLTLGASQSGSLADFLKNTAEPTPASDGYVSIKHSLIKELDVLDKPNFSAKKVGLMSYGTSYPYSEISVGWYKIKLSGNISGWVNERDVTVADNP